MTHIISFFRSDLFLSLVGGFALGIAGMAMVKPASAVSEKTDGKAVHIEASVHVDQQSGKQTR
jgi:hypothetical protein